LIFDGIIVGILLLMLILIYLNNILILTLTIVFLQLSHPLSIMLILLIQTFLICLITGSINENFWFSYIIFLVFLGGILVIFIYITSLASNEIFNFYIKIAIITITIFIFTLIIYNFLNLDLFINFNNNETVNNLYNISTKETSKSIYKLYNFTTNIITIILINYLFLTLIVRVKITCFDYGPLRNLN